MILKRFLSLILLSSFFLLFGCTNLMSFRTDDGWWIDYSAFQSRFDKLPDSITASSWKADQQDNSNTIHSRILSCDDKQCEHILKITVNPNGKIINAALQNTKANSNDDCFAEISFHMFCSMGFNDKDAKGNMPFKDIDHFYAYFDNFTHSDTEQSMSVNNHEVKYTYQDDSKTQHFNIFNMRSE